MRQLIIVEVLIAFLPLVAIWCWGLAMWLSVIFSASYHQNFDWLYLPFVLSVPMGALGLIGVWLLTMDVVSSSVKPKYLSIKLGLVVFGVIALLWSLHPLMAIFGWVSLVGYLPLAAVIHLVWLSAMAAKNRVT